MSLYFGARLIWIKRQLDKFLDAYDKVSPLYGPDPEFLEDIADKVLPYIFYFWNWDFSSLVTNKDKYNLILDTYNKMMVKE